MVAAPRGKGIETGNVIVIDTGIVVMTSGFIVTFKKLSFLSAMDSILLTCLLLLLCIRSIC